MLLNSRASLRQAVACAESLGPASVAGADVQFSWSQLTESTTLEGGCQAFVGRSVLIAHQDQMATIATLLELDGWAKRVVLYPADLSLAHLEFVAQAAAVDVLVTDRDTEQYPSLGIPIVRLSSGSSSSPATHAVGASPTEWVLLTSGTTGRPKLVLHTLASLTDAIDSTEKTPKPVVWSTFYDIRRYGGLQIFLRAAWSGAGLVLSSAEEATSTFLARAAASGVTHISGTPSHWRRALMSASAQLINPEYVRLSGEAADQGILNQLRAVYPQARIAHAFATTEAGVAFAVNDGLIGFPASVLDHTPGVEMKVEQRTLRIRSSRTARCYLGDQVPTLQDADGFVDTGDVVELRDDRYHFMGRGDGMINVGGMKVYAEEVEAAINAHPRVHMSLVSTRKNPITGALVVADVVLTVTGAADNDIAQLNRDILRLCRETLAAHKVPATIRFVPELAVADSGKLIRRHA